MAYRKFDRLAGSTPGEYLPEPGKLEHYCYGCKDKKTADEMAMVGVCLDHYAILRAETRVK